MRSSTWAWLRVTLALSSISTLGGCEEHAASQGSQTGPTPLVDVAKVTEGPLRSTREFYGVARSKARAELSPAEPGTVLEVLVREGDRVETGQTLLRIDPGLVQARLKSVRAAQRQIEARRELAVREAERFESAGALAVPAAEIDRASSEAEALRAQKDSLEAEEVSARVTLNRHQIAAPFAGVIAGRFADPGDWITPGEQALTLVAENQVEVLVSVDADTLPRINEEMTVELIRGGTNLPARVIGVVRALDPQTRTAQVRVIPTEVNQWLIPGLSVNVRFRIESEEPGVLVPLDALVRTQAESRVIVIKDGKANPVVVTVVGKGTTHARVRADELKPGLDVVVRGGEQLRADQAVKVRAP